MTAVERLQSYASIESEKSITKQHAGPLPEEWPQKGVNAPEKPKNLRY